MYNSTTGHSKQSVVKKAKKRNYIPEYAVGGVKKYRDVQLASRISIWITKLSKQYRQIYTI